MFATPLLKLQRGPLEPLEQSHNDLLVDRVSDGFTNHLSASRDGRIALLSLLELLANARLQGSLLVVQLLVQFFLGRVVLNFL